VILGGGVIGLCCAYYLRREGYGVTILERGQAGQKCSLHNAGLIVPSHVIPLASPGIIGKGLRWMLKEDSPFYLQMRLSPSLARWGWLFYRSSREEHATRSMTVLRQLFTAGSGLFEEFAGQEGMAFGLERRGILMLYRTEPGKKACEEEARHARTVGVHSEMLDDRALRELQPGVPFRCQGAAYYPDDGHLLPAEFVTQLKGLVLRLGVRIREGVTFLGWERGGSGVSTIRTGEGAFRAETYVLAGGSWSGMLARKLGQDLPLEPGKGYSLTVPQADWRGTIPLLLTEDRVAVTPLGAGVLRFAGTMEFSGFKETISPRRLRAIARTVPRYLGLPEPSIQASPWAGLRPCTPDGLPYVGRFAQAPNVIAATGHAMLGLTLAPVTGRIVADIVARRSPGLELAALDPDRFRKGRRRSFSGDEPQGASA